MKLVNYRLRNESVAQLGVCTEKGIVPLQSLLSDSGVHVPEDMISLIECFGLLKPLLSEALALKKGDPLPLETVKLESPIPYPRRNVFCLGKNYMDHVNEIKNLPTGDALPKAPIYFTKVAYPTIGDGDPIENHKELTDGIDYEVELAIIIGKKGKNIPKESAKDYIFGYTIGNDLSVRNLQSKHVQWFKGKSLDSCCPLGPAIVTREDFSYPPALSISSKVNGQVRQQSNTKELIFSIDEILSDFSKGLTLYPGDIILTGTPAGVGFGFDPPKLLHPGDTISCEIEGIGSLTNTVAQD